MTVWDILTPVPGYKSIYSDGVPGVATVAAPANAEVTWTAEGMPGVGVTYTSNAAETNRFPIGLIRWRRLLASPLDFGRKKITATRVGRTRETYVYLFFLPNETNPPLSATDPVEAAIWPNCYYYWRQTVRERGVSPLRSPFAVARADIVQFPEECVGHRGRLPGKP